jgi:hypothetical protein
MAGTLSSNGCWKAMRDHSQAIRAFFDVYAKRFNDALADPPKVDIKGVRDAFANYFVGTNPKGVRGGRNGLLFGLFLRRGYTHYRKIGCKRMTLQRVDVSGIDDFHAIARTHWSSLFRKRDKTTVEIEFDNIYLLHIPEDGEPKIFAYITPDEHQALKDHGIG